ncbi:hypothetical protein MRX96_007865 [Rhipicephalus microplus]
MHKGFLCLQHSVLFNRRFRRSDRCHVKGHLLIAVLGVAVVVSSVSGFRALKHGKWSNFSEATLSAFENASSSTGARVLAAVGSPSLPELAQSASLVRRVGEAAVRWLVARGFFGLAFVNYRTTTDKLEELAGPLEELQNVLSVHKLEIALSLSLRDWLSPNALISTRLYSIAQRVPWGGSNTLKEDFKVRASVCFSLSLGVLVFAGASTIPSECKGVHQRGYDTGRLDLESSRTPVLYDQLAVNSDNTVAPHYLLSSMYRIGLGSAACVTASTGTRFLPLNPHGGASVNKKNEELASYEDATIGAKKVSAAIQKTASACVAVFDVDMDDYEGVCGTPFARLRSLHRGDRRPLLCILVGADRPQPDRVPMSTAPTSSTRCDTWSMRKPCGQFPQLVTSMTAFWRSRGRGLLGRECSPVLVALDERALERVSSHELAQQTSVLFHRYGIPGLALLYVAMPVTDAALLPALVILHTTYKQNNLCLLFSVQVLTDADDTSLLVPSIRQIARLTDMFVLNTHYPGFVGPCRVMAASTLHEERKTCIPTLPMDTAAEWLRQIEEESPQGPLLFLSVDARAFRYRVYQRPSLEASCNLEEHVEYSQVCNTTGWRELEVRATVTTVTFKGNEVLSFETPESMKTAALTVRRASQRGSVAVFNVDFEDWQGSCLGNPYPRLSALRTALDKAEVDLPASVEPGSGSKSRELVLEDGEPGKLERDRVNRSEKYGGQKFHIVRLKW